MTHPYAEVWVEFLTAERGGRSTPIHLNEDASSRYRPHFRVGSGELLGVEFIDGPDDPVAPGANTFATVRFLYEPNVSYSALVQGAEFDVLEGHRVVAHGRVSRR
jgi:hypothetical protein